MKFKEISIKNFRNFENITIRLDNKNVFFGMNDVGKTNFLYALRYVFDKDIRRNNLVEADFFQRHISEHIEIIVSIDISDFGNPDSDKLRAKAKGVLRTNQNIVYIKLVAEYDQTEMFANPILYWGGDINDLYEMKMKGNLYEIDYVFSIIYIDAYVDLYTLFKKNTALLLKNDDEKDGDVLDDINNTVNHLNEKISSLSGIKEFEKKVTPAYHGFRNDSTEVSIKSEIAVNGLYSNVIPYIKSENSGELYPTSGEGRKKLLVYSIYDLLAEENEEKKVNLYLIEEPENHLHRSMQLSLSKHLFVDQRYKYMFMTTHSSYVLEEMDNVNLVRIFNCSKIDTSSSFYTVPDQYNKQKRRLNKGLSEAIFADKVLLIEGPSEDILFSKVLSVKKPYFEADGIYILQVNGVGFSPYIKLLTELRIPYVLKTDNDLRQPDKKIDAFSTLGFSRVNDLIGEEILPQDMISIAVSPDKNELVNAKRNLYDSNKDKLDSIRADYHIYLSKVSLEEDLDEVLHDKLDEYLPDAKGDVVSYLQNAKKYNMVELVEKLTDVDCLEIFMHYNFKCLEDILEWNCQMFKNQL